MDDLIDRQSALDALSNMMDIDGFRDGWAVSRANVECMLRYLPPAEPETAKRIVGRTRGGMIMWYQCEMCNEPVDKHDTYCWGCGRRLIDE